MMLPEPAHLQKDEQFWNLRQGVDMTLINAWHRTPALLQS